MASPQGATFSVPPEGFSTVSYRVVCLLNASVNREPLMHVLVLFNSLQIFTVIIKIHYLLSPISFKDLIKSCSDIETLRLSILYPLVQTHFFM